MVPYTIATMVFALTPLPGAVLAMVEQFIVAMSLCA
jgi:hypothetical protein